ncbi:hypothetical protein SNEBB_006414 [Seison nebaliae]|nr:hypothetical protein SNEBB_006414 [Seison nebaliae]
MEIVNHIQTILTYNNICLRCLLKRINRFKSVKSSHILISYAIVLLKRLSTALITYKQFAHSISCKKYRKQLRQQQRRKNGTNSMNKNRVNQSIIIPSKLIQNIYETISNPQFQEQMFVISMLLSSTMKSLKNKRKSTEYKMLSTMAEKSSIMESISIPSPIATLPSASLSEEKIDNQKYLTKEIPIKKPKRKVNYIERNKKFCSELSQRSKIARETTTVVEKKIIPRRIPTSKQSSTSSLRSVDDCETSSNDSGFNDKKEFNYTIDDLRYCSRQNLYEIILNLQKDLEKKYSRY